jgi:hypothetical protein
VRPDRRWFVAFVALFVSACGRDPAPSAPTPTPVALVRVDIDGPTQQEIGTPGGTLQLRALATLADGTRPDVTSEAAWSVTDPRVLAVSSRGLVTGLADGGTIVTATYRDRAGATNVRVGPVGGRPVLVTGVVVDAERGTPIADAEIRSGSGEGERLEARTDGNGFFSLGEHTGHFTLFASQFGYETAVVNLGALAGPTRVEVRLRPNPGDYIERQMTGAFTKIEGSGSADATLRVVTLADGVFDAIVRSPGCSPVGSLAIFAQSGGSFIKGSGSCEGARVRFVVPAPEILLTIRAHSPLRWELTFREPR